MSLSHTYFNYLGFMFELNLLLSQTWRAKRRGRGCFRRHRRPNSRALLLLAPMHVLTSLMQNNVPRVMTPRASIWNSLSCWSLLDWVSCEFSLSRNNMLAIALVLFHNVLPIFRFYLCDGVLKYSLITF